MHKSIAYIYLKIKIRKHEKERYYQNDQADLKSQKNFKKNVIEIKTLNR